MTTTPDPLRRVQELADGAPPETFIADARRRAPSAAVRTSRRSRVRRIAAGAGATLLVAFAFTAPGRAATGWISNLAGFGEEPTLDQPGSVPGSAVVLTSGELADGTAYEVVAKKVLFGQGPDTRQPNDPRRALLCIQVDFVGISPNGQGGHCTDGKEYGTGIGAESAGLYSVSDGGVAKVGLPRSGDAALWVGFVESSDADSVRIESVRPDGATEEIPSQVIDVSGSILRATGTDSPVGVFVVPLDSELIASGRRGELEVRAMALSESGIEVGHTDVHFCPGEVGPIAPPQPGTTTQPVDPTAQVDRERDLSCGPAG